MHPAKVVSLTILALLASTAPTNAETRKLDFAAGDALDAWTASGDVAVDPSKGQGALKVAPGARAVYEIGDVDTAGQVTFRVYEDSTARKNEGQYGCGPLVGVMNSEGRVVIVGPVFAKYLKGNSAYCAAEYALRNEKPWYNLSYLGVPRDKGWHEWRIVFDPTQGVSLFHNGRKVTRFDAKKFEMKGFSKLVVVGDDAKTDGQDVWVDDVQIVTAGEMKIDPLARILPESDPMIADAPDIVADLKGKHPRLLFGAEDIPALRAFVETPEGKVYYDTLMSYLGACKAPKEAKFLRDATDGQRQGLWRMPTVALHYVLTGEKRSFDRTVEYMELLLSLPHWETGELDNGMSAANIMIGAALAYDWLYHDLDPQFREQYRQKLWSHARRMYHGGHLMKDKRGVHYWENDPQNNHRWHRNAGLALCTLAAYTGEDHQKWLMKSLYDEMNFVVKWLPEDGTSHESFTYQIFGGAQLLLGVQATDRCFGTKLMDRPFFANLPRYMAQSRTPGLTHRFCYGDQGGVNISQVSNNVFELITAGRHNRKDELAAVHHVASTKRVGATMGWLGLLWYPRGAERGSYKDVPEKDFFADIGLLLLRDGWEADDAGAMFKCGPLGGYLLNRYRMTNDYHGINIAHDDPDANSFILFTDGAFVAETDRYSKHKKSSNHNTVLINGVGQTVVGRGEGGVWSQPAGRGENMADNAVVVAYAESGDNVAIEGEAAGAYAPIGKGDKTRPAIDRYRRAFIWVEGKYVLVLDDIRAPKPVEVDWLIQGKDLTGADAAGRYVLSAGEANCPFMVVSDADTRADIVESTADHRGKPLGWKQLRLTANTPAMRVASIYDLWNRGSLEIKMLDKGLDKRLIVVGGRGIDDVWEWQPAAGGFEPSTIRGATRTGEEIITLSQPEPETRKLLREVTEPLAAPGGPMNMDHVKVTASRWEQKAHGGWADFPPAATVDGDTAPNSSWRADGRGEWICYDLGSAHAVGAIELAFVGGTSRTYNFAVEVSGDGETWTEAYKGRSSGSTNDFETVELNAGPARYVRVVGDGNSNPKFAEWINITEARIVLAAE